MPARPSRRTALQAAAAAVAAGVVLPPHQASAATSGPVPTGPASSGPGTPADPWDRVPEILARIVPPTFPGRRFRVTDFGAVGDGTTKNTDAFRAAVGACHAAGGGRVVVPEGRFLTGAIHLLSEVELHVEEGATIAFSTDPRDYLPVVFTRWESTECWNYSPFVYARGQHDIAVTGPGTLDGQASRGVWESWYRTSGLQGPDQRLLREMGANDVPVDERVFGGGHYLRPAMLQFHGCENVLVEGVTITDPAMWTINPVLCTNVTVKDVTVTSFLYNTDGVDPECSRDVLITGCRFDTTDDCVAVKSGRDADGRRVGVPSENIVVRNCLFSGRWGGITIGSEMSGGARNIFTENCVANSPDFPGHHPLKYVLYVKTNKRRGGFIDGVYVRNISGRDLDRDVAFVNMNYNSESGTQPVLVRDLRMDRIEIDGARSVLNLVGLESDHLRDFHLTRSTFTGIEQPDTVTYTDLLERRQVSVDGTETA
nr:glycoside hydrolase family 28 protein [Streptomyces sp. NBC_00830]